MTSRRILFTFSILIAGFIVPYVVPPASSAHAQTVRYGATAPHDTDLDGLTDQGEAQIFDTDPLIPDTDADGYLDGAEVLLGSDPNDAQDPAHYITSGENGTFAEREIPWPWYVARATGLEAYLILFLITVLGVGIYTKKLYRFIRSEDALVLHKHLSIFAGLLLVAHIVSLMLDTYIRFRWYEVFLPFASHFKNAYVGIGIIGFYLFAAILISSLFFRARFPRQWRTLHYLTYPLFFIGLIHGIFVGTDTQYLSIQIMYGITGTIGIALTAYRNAYPYLQKKYAVVVESAQLATKDIVDLTLTQDNGAAFPPFKPGQYVALAAYGANGKLGRKHYFSIAGSPNDRTRMRFGIRVLGHFTQSIAKMHHGDRLALFGPYGDFTFDPETMRRVVFIAGGVGITPFLSTIRYAAENRLANDLTLIYSNKSRESTAFYDEISAIAEENQHLKAFFLMSEEKPTTEEEARLFGRLDETKLRYATGNELTNTYFFLCGPPPFMDAATKLLRRCGVSPYFIRKEQFYAT